MQNKNRFCQKQMKNEKPNKSQKTGIKAEKLPVSKDINGQLRRKKSMRKTKASKELGAQLEFKELKS